MNISRINKRKGAGLRVLPVAVCIVATLLASACGNRGEKGPKLGDRLYAKSVELLRSYTDSLTRATDSASLQAMIQNFETALDKVNFEYPAETDFQLTEGQNDTLAELTTRFIETRDLQIKKILGIFPTDSTGHTDSTYRIPASLMRPASRPAVSDSSAASSRRPGSQSRG